MRILYFIIRYILGSKRMRRYRRSFLVRSFRKLRRRIRIRRVIKHMASLAVTAAAWGLAISSYEKNHPVYARYRQDSHGKLEKPVRLVFLTDLHEKEFGRGNRKLLSMIDKVSPDAILIGGDMPTAYGRKVQTEDPNLSGESERHGISRLLHRKSRGCRCRVSLELCRRLAQKYPVYYGLGNHELRMPEGYMKKIAAMGVKVLDDEAASFKGIDIVGLTLPRSCYGKGKFERPDIGEILGKTGNFGPDRYTVMMAHSPNFLDEYALTGADLVLSGHFHGGTIRLTKEMGLMTPQYQLFNSNCHGIKHKDGTDMIISSGLGTHSINIRINDRPEVVVVDVR